MEVKSLCVHCGIKSAKRSTRFLCWKCYAVKEIKDSYPKPGYKHKSCRDCTRMFLPATSTQVRCDACKIILDSQKTRDQKKNRNHHSGVIYKKNCRVCQREFETGWINQKTCGRACAKQLRKKTNCFICGKEFETSLMSQCKYCSDECKRIGQMKKQKEYQSVPWRKEMSNEWRRGSLVHKERRLLSRMETIQSQLAFLVHKLTIIIKEQDNERTQNGEPA